MAVFVIKHKSGGYFVHPYGGKANPDNDTGLVLHPDLHDRTHFIFEVIDGHWGYIKHVRSGKIFHPYGGWLSPWEDTGLVLHSDRHAGALFALDWEHDEIVHKGGKFMHPWGGWPNPGVNTRLVLHSDRHDAMKFLFVDPFDTNTEVAVYGKPILAGEWKIFNMVKNPIAEHTYIKKFKVGKSRTESTEFSVKFGWETTVGASYKIASAEMKSSVEFMFKKTSSQTWSEETEVEKRITVKPGETVVTWQYVFDCCQHEHRGVFKSNIMADTNSELEKPGELDGNAIDP